MKYEFTPEEHHMYCNDWLFRKSMDYAAQMGKTKEEALSALVVSLLSEKQREFDRAVNKAAMETSPTFMVKG